MARMRVSQDHIMIKKKVVYAKLALGVLVGIFLSVGGTAIYAIPTFNSDYLIGTVDPGSPSDQVVELARLETLIQMYNTGIPNPYAINISGHTYTWDVGFQVPAPELPEVTGYGSQVPVSGGLFSFDLGLGSDYTMVKWGNTAAYYWTQGFEGMVEFDNDIIFNTGNGNPLGGSHVVQFNRVPDGGITLMLLGLGITGLAVLRRRLI